MNESPKQWKLWLHGKATKGMSAQEVEEMFSSGTITEDTLTERLNDQRGWTALRSYRAEIEWEAGKTHTLGQPPPTEGPDESVEPPKSRTTATQDGGCILLLLGVILGVSALCMSITVTAESGREVNNLGLMNDRMVSMLAAGFLALIGALMILLGGRR
jgi:hypothetical protein